MEGPPQSHMESFNYNSCSVLKGLRSGQPPSCSPITQKSPDIKIVNSQHYLGAACHLALLLTEGIIQQTEHHPGDSRASARTELFWWTRAQVEGAGAEAQSVYKGPTCSFPRNILVCVHGIALSVYNWSPEWTRGLTNLIPLKVVLCSVLLTWCLFFYFFFGRESGRGLWSTVSHIQLHVCRSAQINAGGMRRRHEWVAEPQVPSNKWPGWGFISGYFGRRALLLTWREQRL